MLKDHFFLKLCRVFVIESEDCEMLMFHCVVPTTWLKFFFCVGAKKQLNKQEQNRVTLWGHLSSGALRQSVFDYCTIMMLV